MVEKKLYVGNLDYALTEEELKATVEEKGIQVKEVTIIKDKATGRSKGFGFVEVETEEQAQKAIDLLKGQELKGRKLTINMARPKPENRRY